MTGDHYARPVQLHAKYELASELSLQHGQTYLELLFGSYSLGSLQRAFFGHSEQARYLGGRLTLAFVVEEELLGNVYFSCSLLH